MNTSPNIFDRLRSERIAKGMTQADMAEELGCTQSAISKLEKGRLDSLSDQKIHQLAQILGIEVDLSKTSKDLALAGESRDQGYRHCASVWCLSCILYRVHGELRIWPTRVRTETPSRPSWCALCGEPMKDRCKKCGAPVRAGAFCPDCGAPRVPVEPEMAADIESARGQGLADGPELWAAVERMEAWHARRSGQRPAEIDR